MNLLIFVLLSFIWTNSGLDTNQSDGSPTTGAKHVASTETKLDTFRKYMLVVIVGIIITAFVFTFFCFIYYYCVSDDTPKTRTLKKEGVAAMLARSQSKTSFSEYKTANPSSLERQSLLSGVDKISSASSLEKSPAPSSRERLPWASSPQKQCMSPSTQKGKNPSSRGKKRPSSSSAKKPKSSHLEKPYDAARPHKLVGQAASSDPNRAASPPWPASLPYAGRPTLQLCLHGPQNHLSKPRRSSVQKMTKSPRYQKLKNSASVQKADMLYRPHLIKPCQCYKEKCLVCQCSEPLLNNTSEANDRNSQSPLFPSEGEPFTQSFLKGDYRDNVFCDSVSNSDIMSYDSDGSNREVSIVCNMKCNETIPIDTHDN